MADQVGFAQHRLLSQRARVLDPDELQAHRLVAESLLGVVDLGVTLQADIDRLEAALALQVSFQVEAGIEGHLMAEARRGSRVMTYRGAMKNRNTHVHRGARETVWELKSRLGYV